jgi:negative regulator of replication initiation
MLKAKKLTKKRKTKPSQIPSTSYQVLSKTGAEEFSLTLIIPKFGWIL